MKALNLLVAAAAASVALLTVSPDAEAHGRWRGSVNLHLGWPGHWWGPGYWGPGYWGHGYGYLPPPPVYYYPEYPPAYWPPAVTRPDPPVYVERDAPEAAAPAEPPAWWYWCPAEKKYYPYVKECPGGWQRVAPQPAPERR